MSRTERRRGAFALLAAALLLGGCASTTTFVRADLTTLRAYRPETARITLTDGTRFLMDAPRVVGGDVAGAIGACEGRLCPLVRGNGRVGVPAIALLERPGLPIDPAPRPGPGRPGRVRMAGGAALGIASTSRARGGGVGGYFRVGSQLSERLGVEVEVRGVSVVLAGVGGGALMLDVALGDSVSLATGLAIQAVYEVGLDILGHGARGGVATLYGIPFQWRFHGGNRGADGARRGVEFVIGGEVGLSDGGGGSAIAGGGFLGLGYALH